MSFRHLSDKPQTGRLRAAGSAFVDWIFRPLAIEPNPQRELARAKVLEKSAQAAATHLEASWKDSKEEAGHTRMKHARLVAVVAWEFHEAAQIHEKYGLHADFRNNFQNAKRLVAMAKELGGAEHIERFVQALSMSEGIMPDLQDA